MIIIVIGGCGDDNDGSIVGGGDSGAPNTDGWRRPSPHCVRVAHCVHWVNIVDGNDAVADSNILLNSDAVGDFTHVGWVNIGEELASAIISPCYHKNNKDR